MSRENVKVVRASHRAWNEGDMVAFRELYDPDVIVAPGENWPEPGPFVGRGAVMRWFEQLRETWDADDLTVIGGFIDAGDRVAFRQSWHGAGQGPALTMEMSSVCTVRDGRIARVEYFWNHADALRSIGREE